MKRILPAITALLLVFLVLTACGGSGKQPLPAPDDLAKKLLDEGRPAPRIFHSIGLQEGEAGLEAAFREQKFFESLPGNPFEYTFKGYPGVHNWDFWDAHIPEALDYMGLTVLPFPGR